MNWINLLVYVGIFIVSIVFWYGIINFLSWVCEWLIVATI